MLAHLYQRALKYRNKFCHCVVICYDSVCPWGIKMTGQCKVGGTAEMDGIGMMHDWLPD